MQLTFILLLPRDLRPTEIGCRQQGYGRGGRMRIETGCAEIVSGVRRNQEWRNWTEALPVKNVDGAEDKTKPVTRPVTAMPAWPARAGHDGPITYQTGVSDEKRDCGGCAGPQRPI
jgi:chorismate synthase